MAKPSEAATWKWADSKVCEGCKRTLKMDEVRVFHQQPGYGRVIFCGICFPEVWSEWMRKHSLYDKELADLAQDRILRRQRLFPNVSGNGTFSEEEYADLIASEVERARRAYEEMRKKRVDTQMP